MWKHRETGEGKNHGKRGVLSIGQLVLFVNPG